MLEMRVAEDALQITCERRDQVCTKTIVFIDANDVHADASMRARR